MLLFAAAFLISTAQAQATQAQAAHAQAAQNQQASELAKKLRELLTQTLGRLPLPGSN